jgi:hypothetical protein
VSSTGAFEHRRGTAVAIDGDRALCGAFSDDGAAGVDSGSENVFRIGDSCLYTYGTGTPGCSGTQSVNANLPPEIGAAAFAFTCDHAPPRSPGLIFVSDSQDLTGSDPFAIGVFLHVDLFSSQPRSFHRTSRATPAVKPSRPSRS